jgi:hypothetical protein
MRAASTSPTETAWIQIEGPSEAIPSGSRPSLSRNVARYLPVARPFQR